MASFIVHDSGNNSEQYTKLKSSNQKTVIYSVPVDVSAGDILVCMGELEVTNDYSRHYRVSAQLVLTESGPYDTTGLEISENNAFNVTPEMHHAVFPKHGIITCPTAGRRYVNYVAWGKKPFKVEQDFGRLQVLQIKQ